ncbi:MAG: efflux RND transporter periplasmic adaptor subunit [Sporomusaceae bacterium]|nr:efflux RND transporter periplasmic adaptor subunit [Sporomusaceae bacterium]
MTLTSKMALAATALLLISSGCRWLQPVAVGITATGTVEITRTDIMPKVSGYITGLTLQAGDSIAAGQTIAVIDRPDLTAQVLRDEAALARAEAQLSDLKAGPRAQERREIAANAAAARSVYEKAAADYQRYQRLYQQGAIPLQQLDNARSSLSVAENSLQALTERLSLAEAGSRPQEIEAQRLEVERGKAVLAASQTLAADRVIISPVSGLTLTKNFENGEYINPGSALATIGDMNDCWVKIYIPSPQLGLLRIGQAAIVKVDSFPDRSFSGTIKEISQQAEFTPRQSITRNERANLVFAVKVKIDNADSVLKPGMPADVTLQ